MEDLYFKNIEYYLLLQHEPEYKCGSLYYNANVEGDTVFVADENVKRNNFEYGKAYSNKKMLLEKYKDYASYQLLIKISNPKEHYQDEIYFVNIGSKNSVTKDEIVDLIHEQAKLDRDYSHWESFEIEDLEGAKYFFQAEYDKAYLVDFDKVSDLTKHATKLVKDKSVLEKLIKDFDDKTISNKDFVKEFLKAYNYNQFSLVEKIAQNHFKDPQKFEIATDLDAELCGKDSKGKQFVIPTKKQLTVYAERDFDIDENIIYSKQEVKNMLRDKNIIVFDIEKLFDGAELKDSISDVTQQEIFDTIKSGITKQMLVDDYEKFMRFYKLAKMNIKERFAEIKKQTDKIKKENKKGETAIKLLADNEKAF